MEALVRNALKCHTGEVDCVGIGNDIVGVAVTVSIAVACIPGFAVCGTITATGGAIATGSTAIGVGWTVYNRYREHASNNDLAITLLIAGGSTLTGALAPGLYDVQVAYSLVGFSIGWLITGGTLTELIWVKLLTGITLGFQWAFRLARLLEYTSGQPGKNEHRTEKMR